MGDEGEERGGERKGRNVRGWEKTGKGCISEGLGNGEGREVGEVGYVITNFGKGEETVGGIWGEGKG